MEHSKILSHLRQTANFSDLQIICGNRQFNVHKCVVCSRSKWFAAACQMERWKEGHEGLIELKAMEHTEDTKDFSCDDPEAVRLMLDYIYLGDYIPGSKAAEADVSLGLGGSPTIIADSSMDTSTSNPNMEKEEAHVTSMGTEESTNDDREPIPDVPPSLDPYPEPLSMESYEEPIAEDNFGFSSSSRRSKHRVGKKGGKKFTQPEVVPYDNRHIEEQADGTLAMHAKLYAMASKYDIQSLGETAIEKLKHAVNGIWKRHDFANAMLIAFYSTPEKDLGLRNVFIQALLENSRSLATEATIETAVNQIDGLGYKLFKQKSLQ